MQSSPGLELIDILKLGLKVNHIGFIIKLFPGYPFKELDRLVLRAVLVDVFPKPLEQILEIRPDHPIAKNLAQLEEE